MHRIQKNALKIVLEKYFNLAKKIVDLAVICSASPGSIFVCICILCKIIVHRLDVKIWPLKVRLLKLIHYLIHHIKLHQQINFSSVAYKLGHCVLLSVSKSGWISPNSTRCRKNFGPEFPVFLRSGLGYRQGCPFESPKIFRNIFAKQAYKNVQNPCLNRTKNTKIIVIPSEQSK